MKRFLKGFYWAFSGVARCVREERNFRFHLCAGLLTVWLALRYYRFSRTQWAVLALTIFGVLALEAVNSAVERAVARPDAAHDAFAGYAKDIAAGAVLLFCLGALGVGTALFWDTAVFRVIGADFVAHPLLFAALGLYAALCFVFIGKKKEES